MAKLSDDASKPESAKLSDDEPSKAKPDKSENRIRQPEVLEPTVIMSRAYDSLDKQIEALDKIEEDAPDICSDLIETLGPDTDIFQDEEDSAAFSEALRGTAGLIGHAIQLILDAEKPEKEALNLPQLPQLPNVAQTTSSNPNVTVNQPPPVVKQGAIASIMEHLSVRRLAKAYERAVEMQQNKPDITTSRIQADPLAYGRQLESEIMRIRDFHYRAQCKISLFNDEHTIQLLKGELKNHCTKICDIILAYTTTIVERRKERFGDRKVGVAAGAMWLEAAKSNALGNLRLSDLLKGAREELGPEKVE
jgi:hypothetical protein